MKSIIEVNHLSKSYKDVKAVDDISFLVHEGEFFSFLGLNGAGKSTTINIITGAIEKDAGKVLVDELDIDSDLSKIKGNLGIVYQSSVLDKFLSVYDNLRFKAALYGYSGDKFSHRLEEISKQFDLAPLLKRPLGKLSGGQKRKVDIARALFHEPKILILDEPTTGLDPRTRAKVWNILIEEQKEKNLTIFLTTHYMEEAAESHYAVILDRGRIVAKGTPLELKSKYSHDSLLIHHPSEEALRLIKNKGLTYKSNENTISIPIPNSSFVTSLILEDPKAFIDYEVIKGKMDDVFLNVTGMDLKEGGNENE